MLKQTSRAAALILTLLMVGVLTVWAAESTQSWDSLLGGEEDGAVHLNFDANGGSGKTPGAYSVQPGQSVTLPSAQLTVNLGEESWHFAGWADASADEVPDYLPGSRLTVTDDLRLYAVYAQGPCQVTYLIGANRPGRRWRRVSCPSRFRSCPRDTPAGGTPRGGIWTPGRPPSGGTGPLWPFRRSP